MNDQTTTEVLPAEQENLREPSPRVPRVQPLWSARQTDDGAILEIALPGVARDALDLEVGNRSLRLGANRRPGPGNARLIRGGELPGGYELELRLDDNLDGTNATAKLEDGVLTVTIPLAEAAKPRRIEIV